MAVGDPREASSTRRTSAMSRSRGRRSTHFGLERLLVLVVEDPGHKRTTAPRRPGSSSTRLAFEDVPGAEVELDRHARTVDSLEERRPRMRCSSSAPTSWRTSRGWKRPERVLELVRLGVAMRPGVPEDQLRETRARLPAPDRIEYFEMEPVRGFLDRDPGRASRGESRSTGSSRPSVAEAIARLGLYAPAE